MVGIVDLAVAVAAVADEVDDDVAAERVAVLHRDARGADDRFGILAVDVEDRDRQALGDVGGEARRSGATRARW